MRHTVREFHESWSSSSPMQFRRSHNPLPSTSAVLGQFPAAPAETTPRAGPRQPQSQPAAPKSTPAGLAPGRWLASPFDAGAQVSLISPGLGPFPDIDSLQLRQRPQQFDDPVESIDCRCPSPRPAPGCWIVSNATRIPQLLSGSPTPGPAADWTRITSVAPLSCRIS